MKIKLIALLLVLTLTTWAQTTAPQTSTQDKPAASETKDSMPCCHGMKAHGKDGMSCCKHDAKAEGKEGMSCCKHDGKDASCCGDKEGKAACMKADKDKTASCCGGDDCCKDGKGCCGEIKDGKKASMKCCGDKCERHAHAGAM
jgi:hypothetical protein